MIDDVCFHMFNDVGILFIRRNVSKVGRNETTRKRGVGVRGEELFTKLGDVSVHAFDEDSICLNIAVGTFCIDVACVKSKFWDVVTFGLKRFADNLMNVVAKVVCGMHTE